MAIPILNHLDLRSASELRNAILHKITTGNASNVEGKIIYDTGTNTIQYYNGSAWINLTGAAQTDAFKTIAVSGQDSVVADSTTDTLTIAGAGGLAITTSAANDRLTFTQAAPTTAQVKTALNADMGGDFTIGNQAGDTATFGGHVTVTGNLTVNGTNTTVNSTTVTIDDPTFTLGGDTAPTSDDNKDRGIEFRWHTGSAARLGFFGRDDSTGRFTFIPSATNSLGVFSGSTGDAEFNFIFGTRLYLGGVAVTSNAAELNLNDGASAGNIANSKSVIYGSSGEVNATTLQISGTSITATAAEINKLDGVTATTAELNIIDGVTATTSEINLVDGNTARGTTAVANGDGFLHNDAGTMRMTNVSKLADLFAGTNISSSNSVLSVADANTTTKGVVEMATNSEVVAGSDSTRAVTASGMAATRLKSVVDVSNSTFISNKVAVITHGLGTRDFLFTAHMLDSTYTQCMVEVQHADANTAKIFFSHVPSHDVVCMFQAQEIAASPSTQNSYSTSGG